MQNAFQLGFDDATKIKNLKYFFISLLISLVLLGIGWWQLSSLADFVTDYYSVDEGWLSTLIVFLVHVVCFTIAYFLIAPLIFVVLSMFNGRIIRNIYLDRYQDLPITANTGEIASLIEMFWIYLKYISIFILCAPLLFLVGFGHLFYIAISYFMFRRLLLLDALSSHLSLQEIRQRSNVFAGEYYVSSTLILFFAALFPGLNLFVPYVGICVLANESMADDLALQNIKAKTASQSPDNADEKDALTKYRDS